MLKCETNTPAMAGRILSAAHLRFQGRTLDVVFEHGQWWLFDVGSDRTYSVVDAEADTCAREHELGIVDGFDFEEV